MSGIGEQTKRRAGMSEELKDTDSFAVAVQRALESEAQVIRQKLIDKYVAEFHDELAKSAARWGLYVQRCGNRHGQTVTLQVEFVGPKEVR